MSATKKKKRKSARTAEATTSSFSFATAAQHLRNAVPPPADSQLTPPKFFLAFCLLGLLLLGATIGISYQQGTYWTGLGLTFSDSGAPLPSSFDAWYFLRLAENPPQEGKRMDPLTGRAYQSPQPLLIPFTRGIHAATNIPIRTLAFYLPQAMALISLLVLLVWGLRFGGLGAAAVASVMTILNPAWQSRIYTGRFDTDGLIPALLLGGLFLVYLFTFTRKKTRWAFLAGYLLLLVTSYLWWVPGAYLLLAGGACYLLCFPEWLSVWEKRIKLIMLALAPVLAGILLGVPQFLPRALQNISGYISHHIDLGLGRACPGGAEATASIIELQPLGFAETIIMLAGHPAIFIVACLGLIWLLNDIRRGWSFILFFAALIFLSFIAPRFAMLSIPPVALGLGYFSSRLVHTVSASMSLSARLVQPAVIVMGLLLALPSSVRSFPLHMHIPPSITHDMYQASSLGRGQIKKATVLSWWDHGYFIQYGFQARTVWDGGSQSRDNMLVMSEPFMATTPRQARGWFKFVGTTSKGLRNFSRVQRLLTSKETTRQFLNELFAAPRSEAKNVCARYGLSLNNKLKKILFPKVKAYVYIPFTMLKLSPLLLELHNVSMDTYNTLSFEAQLLTLPREEIQMDINQGAVIRGGAAMPANTINLYRGTQVREFTYNRPDSSSVYLMDEMPYVFILKPETAQSMLGKLAFPPQKAMEGFTLKYWKPGVCAIWEVS